MRQVAIERGPTTAAQSARRWRLAPVQEALDASRAKKLAFFGDATLPPRISRRRARGGFVRGERDKLRQRVDDLSQSSATQSVSILSRSSLPPPGRGPAANCDSHFSCSEPNPFHRPRSAAST